MVGPRVLAQLAILSLSSLRLCIVVYVGESELEIEIFSTQEERC